MSEKVPKSELHQRKISSSKNDNTNTSTTTKSTQSSSSGIWTLIATISLLIVIATTVYVFQNFSPSNSNVSSQPQQAAKKIFPNFTKDRIKGERNTANSVPIARDTTLFEHGDKLDLPFEYPFIKGSVRRIEWSVEKDLANEIALLDEPVIITKSPADKWRALRVWNIDYISQHLPLFQKVQKHPYKTFKYYHDGKPLSPLVTNYENETWEKVDVPSKEFFNLTQNPPPYYYYAGPAHDLGEAYNDLYPIEPLIVKGDDFNPNESYKYRWTNTWFGGGGTIFLFCSDHEGATTQAHYDVYYNFYVQIYGHKRFILFAPEEHNNLYIFPYLHPASLQSQVDFDHPFSVDFPNFKNVSGIQAILSPGDVLYVPPLWFHHVTALDLSMSVSVWTKAPEASRIHNTWQGDIPFRASWSRSKIHKATRLFLTLLLDSIYGKNKASNFMQQELLTNRYAPLLKQTPSLLSNASFCTSVLDDIVAKEPVQEGDDIPMETLFAPKIQSLTDTFNTLNTEAKKALWLGHFCEQLAVTLVGVENVARLFVDMATC